MASASQQSPPLAHAKSREREDPGARRTSLGFLKRSKSQEPFGRKVSGGRKLTKEQQREEELRRQREAIPKQPPALPALAAQPQLKGFGGEDLRPDSVAIISNQLNSSPRNFSRTPPRNTMPAQLPSASSPAPSAEDPYGRTESMTHRGRYSYASSAISSINSPRRVRRRKDPTPYNILVIGAKNSGKTSFLNFLQTSLALPPKKRPTRTAEELEASVPPSIKSNRNFTHHYLESEIDAERVGLTLWDSQGLEKNVVDLQLRDMSSFLESKFEDSFGEEMKVVRAPGVKDTHIHCVFFLLDPSRLDANMSSKENVSNGVNNKSNHASRVHGILDEDFELQILRTLHGKTTVVPVISKADTITTAHMEFLKKAVWESLKKAGLDPLEALNFDDESEEEDQNTTIDRFDERDEDEEIANQAREEENAEDSAEREDESDGILSETSSPSKRRSKRKSASSMTVDAVTGEETPYLPMSILSPDLYSLGGDGPVGRKFPWGFADPYNPEHCDFVKLKQDVFSEWRADLREASREIWYERWRTSRLNRQGPSANGSRKMGGLRSAKGI